MTRTKKVLVPGGSDARYVASGLGSLKRPDRGGGYLVYVKGSALMAIAFDPTRLETTGTPVTVLPRLATRPIGSGDFDVANDGTLVYVDPPADASTAARRLVWVDRAGHETPLSASLPARPYFQPRVSPDQTQIAVAIDDEEKDIWVWDVARQKLRQLTSGPALDISPVWTTDSRRLIFSGGGLFWQAANGTGMREALKGSRMLASGVTPDGRRVPFSRAPADGADVMAMVLDTGRVESLIETPSDERNGVVSADSHWLAYESNSTGHFAIYVKPYPSVNAGGWTISTEGTRPLWAPNSQELFFVAPDGAIMSVRVDPRGGALNADSPVKVFEGQYATGSPATGRNYDVSRDGKRFLMVKPVAASQAAAPQIQIVQHWNEELKRLVPATR